MGHARMSTAVKGLLIGLLTLGTGMALSPGDAVAEGPDYTLIYYDGHMHSVRSDGSGTVADIKETAVSRGLDAVIVTDHCEDMTPAEWESLVAETQQVSDGSFLAIAGFENTGREGIFNRDHILSYRAPDPFVGDDAEEQCPREVWPSEENPEGTGTAHPENLTQWVEYTRAQGGFAIHNHTSGSTRLSYGVTAIEVYNQSHIDDIARYAKMIGYNDEEALDFAMMLHNTVLYGERDLNTPVTFAGFPAPVAIRTAVHSIVGQWLGSPESPIYSWDDLLMAYIRGETDHPIFAVADSDAHDTGDPELSEVGKGRNGLYVEELTPERVFSAVERGRSFATTGPFVDIRVNGRMMGQTVRARLGGVVDIELAARGDGESEVVKVELIGNDGVGEWELAEPVGEWEESLQDEITGFTYYRVQVLARDPSTGRESYAWSNPVLVRCSRWDGDCDGQYGMVETLLGSGALDRESLPEHRLAEGSCDNGRDDDGDGMTDEADSGCEE